MSPAQRAAVITADAEMYLQNFQKCFAGNSVPNYLLALKRGSELDAGQWAETVVFNALRWAGLFLAMDKRSHGSA